MLETIKKGQNETLTLEADTVANIFGTTDTGVGQKRYCTVNVIGAGTVYLKVVPATDTLTGLVSSSTYHMVLTESDTLLGPAQFMTAPDEILIAVSAGTPDLVVREVIAVA